MLVGWHVEHGAVERLLARAQAGDSGVLVVRGEAGIHMLPRMGAQAFAARATGERPRTGPARPSDALTAQDSTIAPLVATGAASREVGAQLFLSPRTIEVHLRSTFRKLGISSRRQLRDLRLP